MKQEMLINVSQPEECRIAIVEDGVLEELYIEKHELKNQSPEDKVAIAYAAAKTYKPKTPVVSYEEAAASTIVVVKEAAVGAI